MIVESIRIGDQSADLLSYDNHITVLIPQTISDRLYRLLRK